METKEDRKYIVDTSGSVPLKMWIGTEEFESNPLLQEQAHNITNVPGVFHHAALMPDTHPGYGMPIGGVLALESAICPGAVGYDIGCGMRAVKTSLTKDEVKTRIVEVNRAVRKCVPVGVGGVRAWTSDHGCFPMGLDHVWGPVSEHAWDAVRVSSEVAKKWHPQLGTLGSGNHFLEFDYDDEGYVWFVIHSGSRGVGHAIGSYYMNLAAALCRRWYVPVPDRELAFLPEGSEECHDYTLALNVALEYARENRNLMATAISEVLSELFGDVDFAEAIDVHHNYAAKERHFGRGVWVHRKGATRARKGEQLVIPGNMGQGTVICTGLGNPDSFCSSSHGAGRRLGRKQARELLDPATEREKLEAAGVVLSAGRDGALDEMPAAYKDLDVVMEEQSDLVRVDARLRPIGVIKG